ncbi:DUF1998 domain-containing protein, partial [Sesbania bispinosa]
SFQELCSPSWPCGCADDSISGCHRCSKLRSASVRSRLPAAVARRHLRSKLRSTSASSSSLFQTCVIAGIFLLRVRRHRNLRVRHHQNLHVVLSVVD